MSQPHDYNLAHRIANETQLVAEEQWLIEALKKVHKQRNSLQIERLHLESLKSRLLCTKVPETTDSVEFEIPAVSLMQQSAQIDLDVPIPSTDNGDMEALNLAVSTHRLQSIQDMEEEYEEEEMDDEDYAIDMNMLMNGEHTSRKKK